MLCLFSEIIPLKQIGNLYKKADKTFSHVGFSFQLLFFRSIRRSNNFISRLSGFSSLVIKESLD